MPWYDAISELVEDVFEFFIDEDEGDDDTFLVKAWARRVNDALSEHLELLLYVHPGNRVKRLRAIIELRNLVSNRVAGRPYCCAEALALVDVIERSSVLLDRYTLKTSIYGRLRALLQKSL